MSSVRSLANPVADGFAPYRWSPGVDEVAAPSRPSAGGSAQVRPEHTTAPGCAAGAARGEHGAAQRVPGRQLSRARRGGGVLRRPRGRERRRRSGRGRSDPAPRAGVPRPRRAGVDRPADLRALPDRDDPTGRRRRRPRRRRGARLGVQPTEPDGRVGRAGDDRRACANEAGDDRRRRRGVRRVRRPLVRALGRRAAEPGRAADDVEGVRLRLAPGGLCTGVPRDRGAAHGAPGAGADFGPRRRDRNGRVARSSSRRRRGDRGRARACPAGAGERRLRLRPEREATSSSSVPRSRWPNGSRSRGSSYARSRRASGPPSADRPRTTCCCGRSVPSRTSASVARRRSSGRRRRRHCG